MPSTTITDTNGNDWSSITRITDDDGNLIQRVVEYDDGRTYTVNFANGQPTSTVWEDNSAGGTAYPWTRKESTYDAAGNRTQIVSQRDDGSVLTTTLVDGVETSTVIEVGGETVEERSYSDGELAQIIRTLPDGRVVTNNYADGAQTQRVIDYGDGRTYTVSLANGQPTSEVWEDNSAGGTAYPWTRKESTYDAAGNRTQIVSQRDDGSVLTTTLVDGVPASTVIEEGGETVEERSYSDGELTQIIRTLPDGRVVTNDYADGARTQRTVRDESDDNSFAYDTIVTTYDANGDVFETVRTNDDGEVIVNRLQNTDPEADDDDATTTEGVAVDIDVLDGDTDADGDALEIVSVGAATSGTVMIDDKGTADISDDTVVYTPNAGFTGQDSFTYTINDDFGGSATATVTVDVTGAATPVQILAESFETDGNGTRYATSVAEFSDGSGDFFTRTDGDDIGSFVSYNGATGTHYFAAMDIDGEVDSATQSLDFTGIDITGVTDLALSFDLAEDDDGSNQDWDDSDYFSVQAQIDGGGYTEIFRVANDGSTFNSAPFVDTNLDGVGDGTEITDTFAQFMTTVAGSGSALDLKFEFSLNSGDEDIALDNIVLTGTPAGPVAPTDPVINEFVANHTGNDDEAFIEIKGDANTDYSNLWLLQIEGDANSTVGTVDAAIQLGTTDANGYWVTPEDTENGTVSFLLVENFTGSVDDDLDAENDGTLTQTPWDRIVDSVATTEGDAGDQTYGGVTLTPGYDGNSFQPGGASRIPDGTDTDTPADWVRNDFSGEGLPGFSGSPDVGEALNTPGAENVVVSAPEPVGVARINEIHYDNDGADVNEFVEIRTTAGMDVTDMVVELYNGSGGTTYDTLFLSSVTPTTDGTYDYYVLSPSSIQNGPPDGVALSNAGMLTEFLSYGGTFTATDGVANGETSTDIGVEESGSTLVGQSLQRQEDGSWCGPEDDTPGAENVVCDDDPVDPVDPTPTATLISSVQGTASASAMVGQTVTVTAIVTYTTSNGFFLQEEESDYDGDAATSEGIFVFADGLTIPAIGDGVSVTGSVSEFFDKTQITASQISVLTNGNTLPGYASISLDPASAPDFEALEGMRVSVDSGTSDPLQVITNFNLDRFGEYWVSAGEQYQPTQLYDAQTEATQVAAELQGNLNNRLLIDDNKSSQNPTAFEFIPNTTPGDNGNGYLDAADDFSQGGTFRIGTEFTAPITGVLDYGFGEFRVQPDQMVSIDETTNSGARPSTAPAVGGDLQVASFNVLNYFSTPTDSGAGNPAGQERGATTEADLQIQAEKLAIAILDSGADVIALQEIENRSDAITALAQALQAESNKRAVANGTDVGGFSPDHDWIPVRYLDEGFNEVTTIGTDAITTGLMYNSAMVQLQNSDFHEFDEPSAATTFALADTLNEVASSDDQVGNFDRNRPATAATFEDMDGNRFTVVSVHFKSKGDSNLEDVVLDAQAHVDGGGTTITQADIDALKADPNYDQGNGQGFWNQVRTDAANELKAWIEGTNADPADNYLGTGAGDNLLILGDFNAYSEEDPTQVYSEDADYLELLAFDGVDFDGSTDDAFSFVFDGQQGALDQGFASDDMASVITNVVEWHINANEPDLLNYSSRFNDPGFVAIDPYASSDHDPLLIGLTFPEPEPIDIPIIIEAPVFA